MEKRSSNRKSAQILCHCYNIDYFGTITNISINGMFIRTEKINLPLETQFVIFIPLKEKTLSIPVKVNRITKTVDFYDGIGVELMKLPLDYLLLFDKLTE